MDQACSAILLHSLESYVHSLNVTKFALVVVSDSYSVDMYMM